MTAELIPKHLFDATDSSGFNLPARTPDGMPVRVDLRWPTDAEWGERRRAQKVVIHNLGRGKYENERIPSLDTDLKIFETIKQNGAPPLDPDEACRLLNMLETCEIRDVLLDRNTAEVKLSVLGGVEVRHHLKVPSARQMRLMLDAASKSRSLPRNKIESRIFLEPPAKLWDECEGRSEDYKMGVVPAPHKDIAIRAVIDALNEELASAVEETDDF